MKDRVSLYPGRVKLAPVPGQENTYDMVRADSPTQEGTPLNKDSLLKDATASLYGLPNTAVPDDVLALLYPIVDATAKHGNCQIGILQYTGTGEYGSATPTRITFPRKPAAFLVTGRDSMMVAVCEYNSALVPNYNSLANVTAFVTLGLAWTNNEVAFSSSSATQQMNDSGVNFLVIAFYAMDSE